MHGRFEKKAAYLVLHVNEHIYYKIPERYATINKDNVISFENRELFEDPLTGLIRTGARQLIALGVEAELDELMAKYDGQHRGQFLVLAKASPQVARMPQHHGEQIQPPPKVRLGQELHLEMGKVHLRLPPGRGLKANLIVDLGRWPHSVDVIRQNAVAAAIAVLPNLA